MASTQSSYAGLGEGQSTTRPPLFDGTNYTYWKERMRIYIQSTNFLLWRIIKNGEDVPMKKVEETNVPKTENEYDAQDIKKVENNAKAINIIYCAVNPDDYRKIKPKCPNAKNEKEKKPFKKHRAYISWGGDSSDESLEGEENESANLCLTAHEEPPEE
ncbi:unnamed protein product, partial [Cuscuta campestris]